MYTAMEVHLWSWIYFVSFVVVGTFVIINLFIAVVINNLEESKALPLAALTPPVSNDERLKELANKQQALLKLQKQINRHD